MTRIVILPSGRVGDESLIRQILPRNKMRDKLQRRMTTSLQDDYFIKAAGASSLPKKINIIQILALQDIEIVNTNRNKYRHARK